jgi:hypothetical protein
LHKKTIHKIVKLFIIRLYLSESNITYVFIHVDKKQIHTIFHTIIYTETNTPFDPNIKNKKKAVFFSFIKNLIYLYQKEKSNIPSFIF